ncbi:hypothetical protein WJX73_004048 [Symbiochloris irregularis]|uniref:HotDog ACOT-type domain-containing protein n=1 Tax=Symbiochloris irregularis TaxID=706552 RepID=A0AAW1PNR1_9CHLO
MQRGRTLSLLLRRATVVPCRFLAEDVSARDALHGIGTPITLELWNQRLRKDSEAHVSATPAEPVAKVPYRTTIAYPFTSNRVLHEKYRNPWGAVRIGKLLEDLDSLAGNVAFLHCDPGPGYRLPMLVTASVDAIQINHRLNLDNDLEISGQVVWTGTSSMDIRMELKQAERGDDPSLVALFTFVARDPVTKKSTRINPLDPRMPREKELFAERQQKADARKAARQRNLHGRVFGGFLMRRAYELAFATAYMFSGTRPRFVMVDEITFQRPVDVGDLLRLRSLVLHTNSLPAGISGVSSDIPAGASVGRVHVQVTALVTQPERVASNITNTFEFIFEVSIAAAPEIEGCKLLKRVLPSTEEEAKLLWTHFPGVAAQF